MSKGWKQLRNDPAYVQAACEECLKSFQLFCILVFKYVYRKEFVWSFHHDEIANALMRVWAGIDKNLVINIPPRYSKTEMICLFVAWSYAHNASCEFLHLSYSDDLAVRNSDKIRQIIKSDFYQDVFCVKIDKDNDKKGEWRTVAGGIFKATATGGQVTGFGAGSTVERDIKDQFVFSGCILIDDPLKPSDAHTVRREQINDHWDETIKSRRNSPQTTPTICIMQRIHEGDFTAHLLADTEENFKVLKMEALRKDGSALWPLKHTVEQLDAMRNTSLYVFSSQYQQEPTPIGGSIFKSEWWPRIRHEPKVGRVEITADTAQKTKEYNDFSVFQAWGEGIEDDAGKIYLLDQVRGKWEAPELKKVAINFINKTKKHYPGLRAANIEDKSSGTGLIQSLPLETTVPIIAIQRNKDKITRAYDAAPHVQAGQVCLIDGRAYNDMFISECSSFSAEMAHLHDDQVDPMMDATDIFLDKSKVPEFFSIPGMF